jgi:hypothetical protein
VERTPEPLSVLSGYFASSSSAAAPVPQACRIPYRVGPTGSTSPPNRSSFMECLCSRSGAKAEYTKVAAASAQVVRRQRPGRRERRVPGGSPVTREVSFPLGSRLAPTSAAGTGITSAA